MWLAFRIEMHRLLRRHGGRRQCHLLRRRWRGTCRSPFAARSAWLTWLARLALLGALTAIPSSTAAAAATATLAVLDFLDCAGLRLGDGRRLVGACTRFLGRPRLARRTLLLTFARAVVAPVAALSFALAIARLALTSCLRSAVRRPRLGAIALIAMTVPAFAALAALT